MRLVPYTPSDTSYESLGKWFDANVNRETQIIEIYVKNAIVNTTSITFTARVIGDANNNVSLESPLAVKIGTNTIDGQRVPWVTVTPSWNGTGDTARSMR